jgi:hypothetical protein
LPARFHETRCGGRFHLKPLSLFGIKFRGHTPVAKLPRMTQSAPSSSTADTHPTRRTTISEERRAALKLEIERTSVYAVSRRYGVTREVVSRLAAGLPVRAGSVLLFEQGQHHLEAPVASPSPSPATLAPLAKAG